MQLGDSGEAADANGGAQAGADSAAAQIAELEQIQLQQRAVQLEQRAAHLERQERAAAAREQGTAERERAVIEREQAAVERAAEQEAQSASRERQLVQLVQEASHTGGGNTGGNSRSVQEALVRAQQLRRQQAARIEELQASAATERVEAVAAQTELLQWRAGSGVEAVRVSELEAELEAHAAQLEETVLSLVQQQALVEQMDHQLACSVNRATKKQLESEMEKIQVQ